MCGLTEKRAQGGSAQKPTRDRSGRSLRSEMAKTREKTGPERQEGRQDQKWNARYRELEAFKVEHGHCNVRNRQGSLGKWVRDQRQAYRKNKLSEERVQKLEDLGFVWNPQGTQPTWDERLDELTKYKAEHGDCKVPKSQGSLGGWVDKQRTDRKKGKLSEERVQKLDALGFVWSPRSTQPAWDERFNELTKYKAENGHCNVSRSHKSLGIWVANQRQAYKKGKLSKERVQRLDDIGFSWDRGTIPNSERRPRGSRPRSDSGMAGDGEGDSGRERKRRAAADDDSAPARSMAQSARDSNTFEDVDPSQPPAMGTELPVRDDAEVPAAENEVEEMEIESTPAAAIQDGSAVDDASVASDDKEQPGPNGGDDTNFVFNKALPAGLRGWSNLVTDRRGQAPRVRVISGISNGTRSTAS